MLGFSREKNEWSLTLYIYNNSGPLTDTSRLEPIEKLTCGG